MQTLKELSITARRPLSEDDATVENMSRVLCSLLMEKLNGKVKTASFWKISIRINADDLSEDGKVLLGVLIVNREFPTDTFLSGSIVERQSYMLEFLAESLQRVFVENGLNTALIDEARRFVVSEGFRKLHKSKSIFNGPSGVQAHIECEQEMQEARVFAVFHKGRLQKRSLVAITVPEEFIFQTFFGSIEWNNLQEPILRKVDGTSIVIAE